MAYTRLWLDLREHICTGGQLFLSVSWGYEANNNRFIKCDAALITIFTRHGSPEWIVDLVQIYLALLSYRAIPLPWCNVTWAHQSCSWADVSGHLYPKPLNTWSLDGNTQSSSGQTSWTKRRPRETSAANTQSVSSQKSQMTRMSGCHPRMSLFQGQLQGLQGRTLYAHLQERFVGIALNFVLCLRLLRKSTGRYHLKLNHVR